MRRYDSGPNLPGSTPTGGTMGARVGNHGRVTAQAPSST